MRILNVGYSLGKGGTERAAQNFSFAYADIGHDSRFLYTKRDGIRREDLEKKKITIYNLSEYEDCNFIKEWNPEVVHLHSNGIRIEEFNKIKKLLPNAKYIETNVFSIPSPWVDQLDLSFQLSHWCNWSYRKRSQNKYRSAVIPNPVDVSAFQFSGEDRVQRFRESYGIKSDDIVIGRIGQHFSSKWSPVLIDVFDTLKQSIKNLKLIIVNPPESILKRSKISPYYSDIVHIDQILGDESLAQCYSSIDVFVLIADQGESFGMVIAESLLCETPVVTLATPWEDNSQGEVLGNRIGGFVAANKKEVLGLVLKLIEDKQLRDRMGLAGRNRIIDLFDSKKVASDALSLINSHISSVGGVLPTQLMQDTEGSLSLVSQFILSSQCGLPLLRLTTGYMPLSSVPFFIANRLMHRVIHILRLWKEKLR